MSRPAAPRSGHGSRHRIGPSRRPEDNPSMTRSQRPLAAVRTTPRHAVRRTGTEYAADVAAAIEELRPDLVVCPPVRLGAIVAAEAAGVPFDVVLPQTYTFFRRRAASALGLGLKPAQGSPACPRSARRHPRPASSVGTGPAPAGTHAHVGRARTMATFFDQFATPGLVSLTSAGSTSPATCRRTCATWSVLDDPAGRDGPWTPPPTTSGRARRAC